MNDIFGTDLIQRLRVHLVLVDADIPTFCLEGSDQLVDFGL